MSSPGFDDEEKEHYPMPKGAKKIGQIHLHWKHSEKPPDGHWSNVGFSQGEGLLGNDMSVIAGHNDVWYFVIGSTGNLIMRYPSNYFNPQDPLLQMGEKLSTIMTGLYGPKSGITSHEELWLPKNETYKLNPCYIPSFKRPKS